MKRAIYITNAILGSLTLLGFLTIYIGLMGMFVVGCLHLIVLIYYFTQWKTFGPKIKQDIRNYCYLLGSIVVVSIGSVILKLEVLFFVAMGISLVSGIYFTVIIYRVYKGVKEIPGPETMEGILDSGLD
ncbi:MAG: hypothetical protein ACKVOK_11160 [Flavobacteriales bacterium]